MRWGWCGKHYSCTPMFERPDGVEWGINLFCEPMLHLLSAASKLPLYTLVARWCIFCRNVKHIVYFNPEVSGMMALGSLCAPPAWTLWSARHICVGHGIWLSFVDIHAMVHIAKNILWMAHINLVWSSPFVNEFDRPWTAQLTGSGSGNLQWLKKLFQCLTNSICGWNSYSD